VENVSIGGDVKWSILEKREIWGDFFYSPKEGERLSPFLVRTVNQAFHEAVGGARLKGLTRSQEEKRGEAGK